MEQLLYRIQYEQDETAFNEFYRLYIFRLLQFAFAIAKEKEAAEEIVHDVLVKLWQQRRTLDKIRNIKVYLYIAVRNSCLNYLRSRRRSDSLEDLLEEPAPQHVQLQADPAQQLITRELQQQIALAVNQLPLKCRLTFKLVREDGFSYKEVADIMNISVKTVDTQLTIALRKLELSLRAILQPANTVTTSKS